MIRDLASNVQLKRVIDPTRIVDNTASVGQVIDLANFHGLVFCIAAGTLADADATFTVLVEESADNSTFTTVVSADLVGTAAGASFVFSDDNTVHKIGYVGGKRYVRLTITPALNTGNADISAVALLMASNMPRSSQT